MKSVKYTLKLYLLDILSLQKYFQIYVSNSQFLLCMYLKVRDTLEVVSSKVDGVFI